MRQLSKTFANFADAGMGILPALPSTFGGRHRGRQTDFYPSENLENSLERGKRLKAVPPVECIDDCITIHAAHIHPCRCELFFHSFFHRYSRTFRQGMSGGSHLVGVVLTIL